MNPSDAIEIYTSSLIDPEIFWHGFPERTGGVSEGPRASLNLGVRWGDSEENVQTNRRRIAEHVGFEFEKLTVTKHVHGTRVWILGDPLPDPPEFDGLVSDRPAFVLGAFAADCVPIVFADPKSRRCAAAHAGWRGTVGGVAANVIDVMVKAGSNPADIHVALGPCIGACCFEVGPEVVDAFKKKFGDLGGMVINGPVKEHVDLRVALVAQIASRGVDAAFIDKEPPCTRCHPERFFSYRRDGMAGGVHMGFIGLRP